MKELRFGDFVWHNEQAWQYLGMDSVGITHLCRPELGNPFNIIEFEQVYVEDMDDFLEANGEGGRTKA